MTKSIDVFYEAVLNGEFTDSQLEILENTVFTEAVSLSRIKAMSVYLKNIHNDTPNEYSDADEVKKFIDKNYSELSRTLKEMEDSKGKATKEEIKSWIGVAIVLISSLITMTVAPTAGVILFTIGYIGVLISIIISYNRISYEKDMIRGVIKLKVSIKKMMNHKNIDDKYKSRIANLLKKLEDLEIDHKEDKDEADINAKMSIAYSLMNR